MKARANAMELIGAAVVASRALCGESAVAKF